MQAEDLTVKAKGLIADRRYQDGVKLCRRVLLSRPNHVPIRLLLGVALLALERYDEVQSEMLAVLRTNPREAAAYRLLGEAYLHDGRIDQARTALEKALEIRPDDEEARRLLDDVSSLQDSSPNTMERWFDQDSIDTAEGPSGMDEAPTVARAPSFRPRPA
ncbi:MAG: tetratricopeptide repeat protein, partial [Myxococcales bacterium]|nr:tetratricopeptide repeat protein [Myxococcales bacterium]